MSYYTDAEHAVAIILTRKWEKHRPKTAGELFQYALFQMRMKDFEEAERYFREALKRGNKDAWFFLGILAERFREEQKKEGDYLSADECWKHAWDYTSNEIAKYSLEKISDIDDRIRNELSWKLYQTGYMLRYGKETAQNCALAYEYFSKITEILAQYDVEDFRVSTVYTIHGSRADRPIEACLLPLGEAWYELAVYYLDGTEPCEKDSKKARELLLRAYNCHCEKGLLTDYRVFGKVYDHYEYKDEIRELSAFRIGRYGRVAEVHPSSASWTRLYQIYRDGFPGDDPLRGEEFFEKSDTWKRMILQKYPNSVSK